MKPKSKSSRRSPVSGVNHVIAVVLLVIGIVLVPIWLNNRGHWELIAAAITALLGSPIFFAKGTRPSAAASRPSSVSSLIRGIAAIELIIGIALIPIGLANLDHPGLIAAGVAALLGSPFLFAVAEILTRLAEIAVNTKNLASIQIAAAMNRGDDPPL